MTSCVFRDAPLGSAELRSAATLRPAAALAAVSRRLHGPAQAVARSLHRTGPSASGASDGPATRRSVVHLPQPEDSSRPGTRRFRCRASGRRRRSSRRSAWRWAQDQARRGSPPRHAGLPRGLCARPGPTGRAHRTLPSMIVAPLWGGQEAARRRAHLGHGDGCGHPAHPGSCARRQRPLGEVDAGTVLSEAADRDGGRWRPCGRGTSGHGRCQTLPRKCRPRP